MTLFDQSPGASLSKITLKYSKKKKKSLCALICLFCKTKSNKFFFFHVRTSWCLEDGGRGFFDPRTKMKLLHFVMEEVFSALLEFPDEQKVLLGAELAVS